MTFVHKDGLETTVQNVQQTLDLQGNVTDVYWDGLETTVRSVILDSAQKATALNVSRMGNGLGHMAKTTRP